MTIIFVEKFLSPEKVSKNSLFLLSLLYEPGSGFVSMSYYATQSSHGLNPACEGGRIAEGSRAVGFQPTDKPFNLQTQMKLP